jgi:hypothetical protein
MISGDPLANWTPSTFPCSTIVLHITNISSYADWARASGCPAAVGYVPEVTPMYVQDAEWAVQAAGLRVEIASVTAITDADACVNGYATRGQSPATGTREHSGAVVRAAGQPRRGRTSSLNKANLHLRLACLRQEFLDWRPQCAPGKIAQQGTGPTRDDAQPG